MLEGDVIDLKYTGSWDIKAPPGAQGPLVLVEYETKVRKETRMPGQNFGPILQMLKLNYNTLIYRTIL